MVIIVTLVLAFGGLPALWGWLTYEDPSTTDFEPEESDEKGSRR